MYLSKVHLKQFRSHADRVFSFDPGVTVISGPNGSGKTNILEAIYVLATGKSFRDSDEYLTQYTKNSWRVKGFVDDREREMRYTDNQRTFIDDGHNYKRFPVSGHLPVVLFEPDDLMLIHGSPQGRRRYIDMCITVLQPGYATVLRRYERTISQRNRLLKNSIKIDEDKLFVWDMLLTQQADVINRERLAYIAIWNQQLCEVYSQIAHKDSSLSVEYLSPIGTLSTNYKQALIHALKARYDRDIAVGATSVGPHRDDYRFLLNGKDFVTTASRGEVRSLVLALKQIEAIQMEQSTQSTPLLLLDDVFSELDTSRQEYLAKYYRNNQVIITTTHHQVDFPTILLTL